MQSCSSCLQSFGSRNLLFKHLKVGGGQCPFAIAREGTSAASDSPPLPVPYGHSFIDWAAANNRDKKCYLYVTGGRIRGRTLSCVERYVVGENRWENCPNMSEARGSHGSAAVDERIFVFGGGGLHSNLSACEYFDGEAWKPISPCSDVRHALAVTSAGNHIFVIGGWRDGSVCSASVEMYDATLDTWTTLPPMLLARRLLAACVHGKHIFVFGGNREDPYWFTNKAEKYDIESGTWQYIADVPHSGEMSAQSVSGSIYVIVHGKSIYRYNEVKNEYRHAIDLPINQWFCFGTAVLGRYLLVFGGIVNGRWCKEAFALDTESLQWARLAPMNHCRRRCAGSVVTY